MQKVRLEKIDEEVPLKPGELQVIDKTMKGQFDVSSMLQNQYEREDELPDDLKL